MPVKRKLTTQCSLTQIGMKRGGALPLYMRRGKMFCCSMEENNFFFFYIQSCSNKDHHLPSILNVFVAMI